MIYSAYESDAQYLMSQSKADDIRHFALGAAIVKNGSLLIIERADEEEFYPNYFELPGGRMEQDETLIEGLIREMKEETGLDPHKIHRYLDTFDFPIENGAIVRQFNFLVEPTNHNVQLDPKEHRSFQWIDNMRAIDDLQMTDDMKKCVEFALKEIKAIEEIEAIND